MIRILLFTFSLVIFLMLASNDALAWGRRGHAVVGETAAYLIADHVKNPFFKEMSYNFGYYTNVPDVIWKADPETYKLEGPQHFMDLEIFERAMKSGPWLKDRKEFEKTYDVPLKAGRAYWRINELTERLAKLAAELETFPKDGDVEKKKKIQGQWFVTAGVIGHYVGDIAQPLHVTENYDGQLSGQKGIHEFFETDCVNEIYPEVAAAVMNRAKKDWPKFYKKNGSTPVFELVQQETTDAFKRKEKLYADDKKYGRDLKKACPKHRELIVERMAEGALYLAVIWARDIGWTPVTDKFYHFDGTPEHIRPAEGVSK